MNAGDARPMLVTRPPAVLIVIFAIVAAAIEAGRTQMGKVVLNLSWVFR